MSDEERQATVGKLVNVAVAALIVIAIAQGGLSAWHLVKSNHEWANNAAWQRGIERDVAYNKGKIDALVIQEADREAEVAPVREAVRKFIEESKSKQ